MPIKTDVNKPLDELARALLSFKRPTRRCFFCHS